MSKRQKYQRQFTDNNISKEDASKIQGMITGHVEKNTKEDGDHIDSHKYVDLEGIMQKLSSKGKWQKRYFLAEDKYLVYKKNKTSKKILAAIDLTTTGEIHCEPSKGPGAFYLELDGRKYECVIPPPWLEDQLLAIDWVNGLKHRQDDARGETNQQEEEKNKFKLQKTKQDDLDPFAQSPNASWGTVELPDAKKEAAHFHEAEDHHDSDDGEEHGEHHHHHATKIQKLLRGHKHRKHAHKKKKERNQARESITQSLKGYDKKDKKGKTLTKKGSNQKLIKRRASIKHRRSSMKATTLMTEKEIESKIIDKLKNLPESMKPKNAEEEKKLRDQLHHFYEDKNKAVVKVRRKSMTAASNESIQMAQEYFHSKQKEIDTMHQEKEKEDEQKRVKEEQEKDVEPLDFSSFLGDDDTEEGGIEMSGMSGKGGKVPPSPLMKGKKNSSSNLTKSEQEKGKCCCVVS